MEGTTRRGGGFVSHRKSTRPRSANQDAKPHCGANVAQTLEYMDEGQRNHLRSDARACLAGARSGRGPIDRLRRFHIVIAASERHVRGGANPASLKIWLWRDEATVLLVSYQAEGTLGRILQNVAQSVRVQGEEFAVRAWIRSIELYSGHADGPELADWIRQRLPIAHELFLVHG